MLRSRNPEHVWCRFQQKRILKARGGEAFEDRGCIRVKRVLAHEARYIRLEWLPAAKAFEFRLMIGGRYLTPRLHLTALDWYALLDGRDVKLTHEKSGPWLVLRRRGSTFNILTIKHLDYGKGLSGVPAEWPSLDFSHVYEEARAERGAKPEEGWQAVYDAEIEAKRAEWGPA